MDATSLEVTIMSIEQQIMGIQLFGVTVLQELVGGFLFSPLFGEVIHFDSYFSNGLKPPTRR